MLDNSKLAGAASGLSPWCFSPLRRGLDVIYSVLLILLSLPLMIAAAILITCSSAGPILFRQERVGRNGVPFELLKLRTMRHQPFSQGAGLTQHGDSRITTVGQLLRNWKIDELPQLFNVLAGHMSLVGPRPDLPKYLNTLPDSQRHVLLLRPGITGAASVQFRNEELLLAGVAPERLEDFYVKILLMKKIDLDLKYAHTASFFSDAAMMLRTLTVCLGSETL